MGKRNKTWKVGDIVPTIEALPPGWKNQIGYKVFEGNTKYVKVMLPNGIIVAQMEDTIETVRVFMKIAG